MYSDDSHESTYNLARETLTRYVELGCDYAEALTLTSRTLQGETVIIRTSKNDQDKSYINNDYTSPFLLDYLNEIYEDDLYDDALYDDDFLNQ